MAGYSVVIKESSMELTKKERIAYKDTTNTQSLDALTQDGNVLIEPVGYVILGIHNEKADPTDYENYIVIDKTGVRYRTGSQSFWNAFINIFEELADETEPWCITVYRKPSKNRQGKDFITCSLETD